MSGPKTSQYTLTPEQRRVLEEQRRLEVEREILVRQQGDVRSVIAEANRVIEKYEPLCLEAGADSTALEQAKIALDEAVRILSGSFSTKNGESLSQIRKTNQDMRTISRKLQSVTKNANSEYSSVDKAFRIKMAGLIDDGFDSSFDVNDDESFVGVNPTGAKIQAELMKIKGLILTEEHNLRAEMIYSKLEEITDLVFLKNFYSMTVLPFVKECQTYHNDYTTYGEEFEYKHYVYETNARKLGVEIENIPFSRAAVKLLDDRIKETEEVIRYQEEQAYISQCVDTVMQEMGYELVGSREVTKKSGKRFRDELYTFSEGTAVNIRYDNQGKIAMELGGIDSTDRLPSSTEASRLEDEMVTFCDKFTELEKRLAKKGVVCKNRIGHLPPKAEYAQIINTSDYDMKAEVETFKAERRSVKGESKMQHRNE